MKVKTQREVNEYTQPNEIINQVVIMLQAMSLDVDNSQLRAAHEAVLSVFNQD